MIFVSPDEFNRMIAAKEVDEQGRFLPPRHSSDRRALRKEAKRRKQAQRAARKRNR